MAPGEWNWKGSFWLLSLGVIEDSEKALRCRPTPWCDRKAVGTPLKQEVQFVLLTQ